MKDVDRLLTTAFLDELERTPSAPVNKRALRDRTFEKLGLERQAPGAEWAQAVTVPRWRSLAWAAAACLVAVVAVSAAFLSTMVIAPGQVSQTSPILGTYLELDVVDASFDESSREMVFTLEAKTDMALDDTAAMTEFEWWSTISFFTETNGLSFEGGDTAALAQWKKTGENTYRCEGYPVEVDTETQLENHLYGDLEGTFNLQISSTSQVDSLGDPLTLSAENTFAIQIPPPQEDPTAPAPGTYLQSLDATLPYVYYDQGLGILHLRAALDTDMALNHPHAGDYYSWEAQLSLTAPDGRQLTLTPLPGTPGENPQAQPTWSVEKSDDGKSYFINKNLETSSSYDTFAFAITNTSHPEEPNYQEEYGLYGSLDGVLTLTCHETTVDGSAKDWEVEIPFTAVLPDPNSTASTGTIGGADGPTVAYTTP